jgi:NADH:ubiquinone oxidoreductase subunit F (NADH-binding)/NADH:ubiquinone oxidoreductase subunit E
VPPRCPAGANRVTFFAMSGERKRIRARPKGRPLDQDALAEVRRLLGPRPRRRDLLIEFLHVIQDAKGCLSARHLKALAEDMRLSEAEVFEVASFYHHFDIVKEGEAAPPALTIRVCDSVSCMIAGAEALIAALEAGTDPAQVRVLRAPCVGRCAEAPAVVVGQNAIGHADLAKVSAAVAVRDVVPRPPPARRFKDYSAEGGYALLRDVRSGARTPEELIAALSDAGLRGMGGAGFPAGRKWGIVRAQPGPKLMTINADEGEPGTFKDRVLLESDPHRMIEGALIAAHVVGAERIYLYLRDEYPALRELLIEEILELNDSGLLTTPIELRRGAGAYICGEESAMLESIEGRRGLPRHRPPYIAEVGLFGRPTLNHNVETLFWLRDILEKGPVWFAAQGRRSAKGFRSFSVSGRVKKPGVKLAPAGITLNELVREFCGGIADGHVLAGYLPGGASGGILPASLADEPLDFGTLEKHGCFIGSHAVVVFSDQDDPRAIALNLMRFFEHESCGQCTPCRAGTEKLASLMERADWDEPLMADIESVMRDASICGLGQAAPNPMRSVFRFFQEKRS